MRRTERSISRAWPATRPAHRRVRRAATCRRPPVALPGSVGPPAPWQSVTISGHQWPSVAISGNQWQSWPSVVITCSSHVSNSRKRAACFRSSASISATSCWASGGRLAYLLWFAWLNLTQLARMSLTSARNAAERRYLRGGGVGRRGEHLHARQGIRGHQRTRGLARRRSCPGRRPPWLSG